MRDLPTLVELLEAVPVLKGWVMGGMVKPTLEQVTAGYVGVGWLTAQGYDFLAPTVSAQSIDMAKACCDLDAFVQETNVVGAKRIGDGQLLAKWGPILAPLLLKLLQGFLGGA